jgi:hypothetical protein
MASTIITSMMVKPFSLLINCFDIAQMPPLHFFVIECLWL